MNYTEIKTNEKMNKVVKEQLIFRDDHLSKYAVKRIEELEQLVIHNNTSVLGWKYEVESKKYRKTIFQYFYCKEWGHETTITQIKTFKEKDKTIVQIETHIPGLLIGKAGVFIDGLKQYLIEELKENIEIDLRECKMWHKLYSR